MQKSKLYAAEQRTTSPSLKSERSRQNVQGRTSPQNIQAWQIKTVSQFSAHASWYVAVIHALTGQPITITKEGKKRYLSVGPFTGDGPVSSIEVGIDDRYTPNDPRRDLPLEKALEILCNRICKSSPHRVQEMTFGDLWG